MLLPLSVRPHQPCSIRCYTWRGKAAHKLVLKSEGFIVFFFFFLWVWGLGFRDASMVIVKFP